MRKAHTFRLELMCAVAARNRRAAALAASEIATAGGGQGPQGAKPEPHWAAFSWKAHVERLTESEFKLHNR